MGDIEQGPVDFRRVDIQAFVKRLVRYYETKGNGDWRYAAETIEQQHAEIERLRARVAELEAAQEWRPIESAPRDGTSVLIAFDSSGGVGLVVAEARYIEDQGWYLSGNDPSDAWGGSVYATHWLPLPAPPKGET